MTRPTLLASDTTAVVLHDAGAANLFFGWARAEGLYAKIYVEGPAREIFSKWYPGYLNCAKSLPHVLDGATALVSGADWSSEVTHKARQIAQKREIKSVAVLDHWVNYHERFEWLGREQLPDEIWVGDMVAMELATKIFPKIKVLCKGNQYLQDEVDRIRLFQQNRWVGGPGAILYILEPVRLKWGRQEKSGEFQALEFFLECISQKGVVDEFLCKQLPESRKKEIGKIVLRPHPSEASEKYRGFVSRASNADISIEIDMRSSLACQIANADWVVGCESFGLAISVAAGKPTMSTIPPWGPLCRLPHEELHHLREIVHGKY